MTLEISQPSNADNEVSLCRVFTYCIRVSYNETDFNTFLISDFESYTIVRYNGGLKYGFQ